MDPTLFLIEERDLQVSQKNFNILCDAKFIPTIPHFNDDGHNLFLVIVQRYTTDNHYQITRLLSFLKHNSNLNVNSGDLLEGNSALHLVGPHSSFIAFLTNYLGVDMELTNWMSYTPLHHALVYDRFEVADILLKQGAKITTPILKDLIKFRNEFGSEYTERAFLLLDKYL